MLTNNPERCSYYQKESENVKGRGYCKVDVDVGNRVLPNKEKACLVRSHHDDDGDDGDSSDDYDR